MSSPVAAAVINNTGGNLVDVKKQHLKRFPFLFLVDISGSTGGGSQPDIKTINRCLPELFDTLRNPPPGSELADQIDQVDVALVVYSDTPTLIFEFCTADKIPPSLSAFSPQYTTGTGSALEFALSEIGKRLRYLKNQKIPTGMPHIFHITDGAPTDMPPGSPRWREISEKLGKLQGKPAANGESRQQARVLHFVTPNGCDPDLDHALIMDENGNKITGQEALTRLTGTESVFALEAGIQSFTDLITLIAAVITSVTKNFPFYEAARQEAQNSHGSVKNS